VGTPQDYNEEAPLAFIVLTATAATNDPVQLSYLRESIIKVRVLLLVICLALAIHFSLLTPSSSTSPIGKHRIKD
jgi:hypothetical protein